MNDKLPLVAQPAAQKHLIGRLSTQLQTAEELRNRASEVKIEHIWELRMPIIPWREV